MNKNSIVPMYQQLADTIKQQILSGELKDSDKLMTEAELGENYHVSRITVRKAINILVENGYVTKKQGIGTFVTINKLNRVMKNEILSFTEMCEAEGKKASSEILSVEWAKAGTKIGKRLKLPKDENVLRIVRLRKTDGTVVMLEETCLPQKYSYITEENLADSIYAILRSHGTEIVHATKEVGICYATEQEAKLLGVAAKQPLLLQYDISIDEKGEEILCSKLLINSERYTLTIMM